MAEVKKAAVIGAGTMGNGIAQVLAQAGIEVNMVDTDDKYLERGFNSIKSSLAKMTEKAKMTEEEAGKTLGRIKGVLDIKEGASDVDVVIEAVFEEIDVKQDIFKKLDEICPAHTVLATNTYDKHNRDSLGYQEAGTGSGPTLCPPRPDTGGLRY